MKKKKRGKSYFHKLLFFTNVDCATPPLTSSLKPFTTSSHSFQIHWLPLHPLSLYICTQKFCTICIDKIGYWYIATSCETYIFLQAPIGSTSQVSYITWYFFFHPTIAWQCLRRFCPVSSCLLNINYSCCHRLFQSAKDRGVFLERWNCLDGPGLVFWSTDVFATVITQYPRPLFMLNLPVEWIA